MHDTGLSEKPARKDLFRGVTVPAAVQPEPTVGFLVPEKGIGPPTAKR